MCQSLENISWIALVKTNERNPTSAHRLGVGRGSGVVTRSPIDRRRGVSVRLCARFHSADPRVCACVSMCMHACMYAYVHVCMHASICMHVHICAQTLVKTWAIVLRWEVRLPVLFDRPRSRSSRRQNFCVACALHQWSCPQHRSPSAPHAPCRLPKITPPGRVRASVGACLCTLVHACMHVCAYGAWCAWTVSPGR